MKLAQNLTFEKSASFGIKRIIRFYTSAHIFDIYIFKVEKKNVGTFTDFLRCYSAG